MNYCITMMIIANTIYNMVMILFDMATDIYIYIYAYIYIYILVDKAIMQYINIPYSVKYENNH
jgi:hypothetical protein